MAAIEPVPTYDAVGVTRDPHMLASPPSGYRARERSVKLGQGAEKWRLAADNAMNWNVKRRSGFSVELHSAGRGAHDAVRVGDEATLRLGFAAVGLREPIRVMWVIDEPRRRGFGYGTLPGHPVSGEECFIVDHRVDDSVWLTTRSISRPGRRGWRLLWPVVLLAQAFFTRRYLRVLAGPSR